jgi:four helix bundle protein
MSEQSDALQRRVKRFTLDVIELLKTLPDVEPGATIRRQLAKAGTGVSANLRAARRSRSHAEFTSRISVVAEEADESMHWLDILAATSLTASPLLPNLLHEANELTAIFSAMVGTARRTERRP